VGKFGLGIIMELLIKPHGNTVVSGMRSIWIAKTSDEFLVGFSGVRVDQWLVFC
jgi:hypothetical protein